MGKKLKEIIAEQSSKKTKSNPNRSMSKSDTNKGPAKKPQKKTRKRAPRPGEGRPSKYDPKYCEMLVKSMGEGLSIEAFAGEIGVTRETIYDWTRRHKEFSDAKKRGEVQSVLYWEKLGVDLTTGKSKGNVTAWIFNMKNRLGWRDKQDITSEGGAVMPKVEIYLPDNGRDKKK